MPFTKDLSSGAQALSLTSTNNEKVYNVYVDKRYQYKYDIESEGNKYTFYNFQDKHTLQDKNASEHLYLESGDKEDRIVFVINQNYPANNERKYKILVRVPHINETKRYRFVAYISDGDKCVIPLPINGHVDLNKDEINKITESNISFVKAMKDIEKYDKLVHEKKRGDYDNPRLMAFSDGQHEDLISEDEEEDPIYSICLNSAHKMVYDGSMNFNAKELHTLRTIAKITYNDFHDNPIKIKTTKIN